MKCLVCGKSFSGNECPVCGFPVVEIPGDDFEAGIRALRPTIDKHRNDFAARVTLGAVVYNYELSVKLKEIGSVIKPFGKASELVGKTIWLDESFENVNTRDMIPVTISVEVDKGVEYQVSAEIPNLKDSDKLRLGISMENDFSYSLLLADKSGNSSSSHKMPLIKE